jgi:PleD family two-component response regulator
MIAAINLRVDVRRVLVVDDNQDAADSLATLLRLWGYDCRVSYDGQDALQTAWEIRPDRLILDINMPGMDGCYRPPTSNPIKRTARSGATRATAPLPRFRGA